MSAPGYDDDDDDDDEAFAREVKKEIAESYLYGSEEIDDEICITSPPKVNAALEERFGQLGVFKGPSLLVFSDEQFNLRINEDILKQVSRIDVAVSVVGVCGVYRTGKSFLLNMLAQERKGFSIGNTTRSETKGIWIWCKPHPKVQNQVVILLDTEGFSDASKGDDEHDRKLFCLTMLMSSVLIYNMKGVIDQDALKRLSFITEVTKTVSVAGSTNANEEEDRRTLQFVAPHFVLCLRDFFFEDDNEGEIIPDKYMESCLNESADKHCDNIRRSIKAFFPRRNCFVLAQPAMNKSLRKLETLPEDQLDGDFLEGVKTMTDFLHNLGPKCLDEVTRKPWDGNAFEIFLRAYIHELSMGEKMEYGTAMESAARFRNSKLKVQICRKYEAELKKLKVPQPSKLALLDVAMMHMYDLLRDFRRDAYPFLVDYFEDKAMETMKPMMENLAVLNSREIKKLCYEYLTKKHDQMVNANQKTYRSKDGIHTYKTDFDELLRKYNQQFAEYDNAERCEALQEFKDGAKGLVEGMQSKAQLEAEIRRYEDLQKSARFDIEVFMKREMEKLKKEQEKKLQEELDLYKDRLSKLSFGGIGFFQRLKFLFTRNITP